VKLLDLCPLGMRILMATSTYFYNGVLFFGIFLLPIYKGAQSWFCKRIRFHFHQFGRSYSHIGQKGFGNYHRQRQLRLMLSWTNIGISNNSVYLVNRVVESSLNDGYREANLDNDNIVSLSVSFGYIDGWGRFFGDVDGTRWTLHLHLAYRVDVSNLS